MATSIDKKLKVTRDQLAAFIKDPNTIKQFENLFAYINNLSVLTGGDIFDAFPVPVTYDISSENVVVDFPEWTGAFQQVFYKWTGGDGTYSITPNTPDGALINGLAASTWVGEGEGVLKVSGGETGWDVEVYEDYIEYTNQKVRKYKDGTEEQSIYHAYTGVDITTAAGGAYRSDIYGGVARRHTMYSVDYEVTECVDTDNNVTWLTWNTLQATLTTTRQFYFMDASSTANSLFNMRTKTYGRWRA